MKPRKPSSKPAPKSNSNFLRKSRPADLPKIDEHRKESYRLNHYLSMSGVTSRRKAVELVKEGKVTVNGNVVKEPGYEVLPGDKVLLEEKSIRPVDKKVYILMNKPRDTITTLDDEKGRKTVMDLIKTKVKERIFPVGRLDRETTGLLLLTNDGDLAQKLSHPSFKVKKFYKATLDKAMTTEDLQKIKEGLTLDDGPAKVEGIDYIEEGLANEVGVEIHIGKNRIVRRIFEHLGYQVERLDRTYYAGLTKKDLPRGQFRQLTEREVIMLKHFV